ncbi:MAG: Arc family DNA-binding protein [Proteobacteria bacterium]|nr:Arc family DNA-binding protein [Pseudomonadota bacterium]
MAKERKTGRAQVGLRVSESMRRRLETVAKSNDRSINAEILERLERSFETEDRLGGPRVIELIETLATVMKSTGEHAGFYETGKPTKRGEWLALPDSDHQDGSVEVQRNRKRALVDSEVKYVKIRG